MIEEEYVTFESAKLLKESGFPQDFDCGTYMYLLPYSEGRYKVISINDINALACKALLAPTQAQAMRWLREEKIISVEISSDENIDDWQVDAYDWRFDTPKPIKRLESYGYPSYEAAAEAGIQAACKYIIENKKSNDTNGR